MAIPKNEASLSAADLRTLGYHAWAISFVLWGFEWVLLSGFGEAGAMFGSMLWRSVWTISGLLVGYIVWQIAVRFRHLPFWKLSSIVIGLFLLLGPIHTIGNMLLMYTVENEWPRSSSLPLRMYINGRFWLHVFLAWAAIVIAYCYAFKVQREEIGRVRAQTLAQQAQIQAFRYQINPHFLFNTFNSIAALILDGSQQRAEALIRRLSAYLRRALAQDATDDTTIEHEFAQQVEYLALEQERFPDRLLVESDLEKGSDVSRAAIPGFLLQPLVENAVRHGVQHSREPTTITLSAERRRNRLVIGVRNAGDCLVDPESIDPESLGQGLEHVRSQLTTRFGLDFDMVAQSSGHGEFSVTIDIPFVQVKM